MPYQELFQQLFKRNSWDAGNASFLHDVINEHPYFSPAHFFLLNETGSGHSHYKSIAAKTSLHFANPYLLNYQLHKDESISKPAPQNEAKEDVFKIAEELTFKPIVDETLLKPVEAKPKKTADDLLFEPLHVTDYFASQGIKLSAEVQPNDKLAQQMKSFTAWLKTMKKSPNQTIAPAEVPIDLAVQRMAENSNKEEEIVTESMAEVYHQQGKYRKASELYQKLSLLDPSKSAYFAAKIELLNHK
jgi:hypothetical protein